MLRKTCNSKHFLFAVSATGHGPGPVRSGDCSSNFNLQLQLTITFFSATATEDMVSSRSFVGMGRPFRLPAPNEKEKEALAMLRDMNLTCRPEDVQLGQGDDADGGDDRWFLTAKASEVLEVHFKLEKPRLAFIARTGTPLEKQTALEMLQHLQGQGFELIEGAQQLSKYKGKAYTGGRAAKSLVSVHRDYLMAMCSAPRLFANSCSGIFHFQLVSYYVALVRVSNTNIPKVVPNKSASFYRSLWDTNFEEPKDLLCLGGISNKIDEYIPYVYIYIYAYFFNCKYIYIYQYICRSTVMPYIPLYAFWLKHQQSPIPGSSWSTLLLSRCYILPRLNLKTTETAWTKLHWLRMSTS